jgi:hypothetical protein
MWLWCYLEWPGFRGNSEIGKFWGPRCTSWFEISRLALVTDPCPELYNIRGYTHSRTRHTEQIVRSNLLKYSWYQLNCLGNDSILKTSRNKPKFWDFLGMFSLPSRVERISFDYLVWHHVSQLLAFFFSTSFRLPKLDQKQHILYRIITESAHVIEKITA